MSDLKMLIYRTAINVKIIKLWKSRSRQRAIKYYVKTVLNFDLHMIDIFLQLVANTILKLIYN